MRPGTYETDSVQATEALAAELAGELRGGECVALNGDLGAGKTQFVRGLVRGLGGEARAVSSPTFVLLNVYDSGVAAGNSLPGSEPRLAPRLPVYHLDAYRVTGGDDFEAIGFAELLDQGGVVVVEWASRVKDLLPPDRIEIEIEPSGPTQRRITIRGGLRGVRPS